MPKKFQTTPSEDYDQELNALNAVYLLLKNLTFDSQWRVLNYILVRLWGRSWVLANPARDTQTGG